MGVNNLLQYLKEANIDIQLDTLPKEYNLSIDLATIIVPIMQESSDKQDFIHRLQRYLAQNHWFLSLLLNACEVRAYLDMFSPRMKMDTLNSRKRERDNKLAQQRLQKDLNLLQLASPDTANQCKHPSPNMAITNQEKKPIIKLREIRQFIAPALLDILGEFDNTFPSRCSFDVYRIGEGEVKCMSYHAMGRPNLPNVIFSNDNDVLLMILLHQSNCPWPNYYRAMMHHYHVLKTRHSPDNTIIVHRFSINTLAPCRWVLVVWIICLCGTDFVLPIRIMTPRRRKILLERCVMYFKQYQYIIALCRQCNFDNFFVIMTMLFAILADDEKNMETLSSFKDNNPAFFIASTETILGDYRNARLDNIAKWCARVYWNILYFIDLPVDFHLQPNRMFKSNDQMAVNIYIENTAISVWSLRGLNALHRRYLYERIKVICQLQKS